MAAEYLAASRVLEKVLKKQGTPKSLTINSNSNNKKKIFALVSETLKYKTVLDDIIEQTKLCASEKQLSYSLALVLVYDFLFGCGLQCGGGLKLAVTGHKASLQAALARMKAKAKVSKNEDLLPETIKHWQTDMCEVNRLKTTTDAVCQQFIKEGFLQVKFDMGKDSSTIPSQAFFVDPHIPDILVFSPGTDLHSHPLYTQGHIILQDKASCFPAHILAPEHDSHVIDACAAPGNKTSHLASIIDNTGRIFAFDLDQRRLNTMDKLMKKAGVKCAVLENKDFLKVDPSEYPQVTHILVDPSCSGSGIINRLDHLTQTQQTQSEDKKRIESLSKFQLSAVLHALSFPSVTKSCLFNMFYSSRGE